jgi:hypothetical protein
MMYAFADLSLAKIAAGTTLASVVVTLAFDIAERKSRNNPGNILTDTMAQCVKFYDIALQDTNVILKYQHMVLAQSYLNVSRHLAPDDVIEQQSGLHIRALQKRIDVAIQGMEKTFAKPAGKLNSRYDAKKASWL